MPRLVVFMAVRNAEGTVEVAIRSTLRALPSADAALHVFDDASDDGTVERIESCSDRRLVIHHSSTRVGSGLARAAVMKGTDSDYVANMDGDDISLPWRFHGYEKRLADADVVFGTVVRFGERITQLRPTYPMGYTPAQSRMALLFHNPFWHPTMVARRSAIEATGGYRALPRAQDYDLWLRMASRGFRIARTGVPQAMYRLSPTQVTGDPQFLEKVRESSDLWDAYAELFEIELGHPPARDDATQRVLGDYALTIPGRWKSRYYKRIADEGLAKLV